MQNEGTAGDGKRTGVTRRSVLGGVAAALGGAAFAGSASAQQSSPGRLVRQWTDPTGDDNGPGSYVYPTNSVFVDGVFDLTGVELYETTDRYRLRYGIEGPIDNPYSGSNGYSLPFPQFYVRRPDADGSVPSTTSGWPGTNVTFADPYHYRVLATGFGLTQVENGNGDIVSQDVTTGVVDGSLEVTFPKSAVGGSLAGAEVSMLLFGENQSGIRQVQADVGEYNFGDGVSGSLDSNATNVIDMIAPDDQTQAEALSYSDGAPAIGYNAVPAAVDPLPGEANPPADIDGDGAYEDVDGDGAATYDDVVTLFERRNSGPVNSNPSAFDFNANGRFDLDDIVTLFENR